jgi:hypothetical protein
MISFKQFTEEVEKKTALFHIKTAPTADAVKKYFTHSDDEVRTAAKNMHAEISKKHASNSWMDSDSKDLDKRKPAGVRYTGD